MRLFNKYFVQLIFKCRVESTYSIAVLNRTAIAFNQ